MNTKTRILSLTAVLATVIVGAGAAYAEGGKGGKGGDGPRGMGRIMQEIDANSDGNIGRDELDAFIEARFAQADADADLSVTQDEIASALPGDGRRGGRFAEHMVVRMDIDGNGTLAIDEVRERAGELFAMMDIDNSGTIEADEMPKRGGKRGERGERGERGNRANAE